jgi:5-methylcytosine-specific restriction endonuclease McrA
MAASGKRGPDQKKLDALVARAQRDKALRERGYREQALKVLPWVCARCAREFARENLHQLTVHHVDHDHQNNPPDGSNWELLCVYCHDNEHSRELEAAAQAGGGAAPESKPPATHKAFAGLESLIRRGKRG